MKILFGFLASFALQTAHAAAPVAGEGLVDLHAHVFMYEGFGVPWFGKFNGPIEVKSWKEKMGSKINPEALEKSGAQVVVVALYTHPLFRGEPRDAIRRQIFTAKQFVKAHPHWVIARSPNELEQAHAAGKKALVFSLEGAAQVLETEQDLVEFIDQEGIRIVTLYHFIDDHFGGAALMRGTGSAANPLGWFKAWKNGTRDSQGVLVNTKGMTDTGRRLAHSLIQRGVWMDLSHATDADQVELTQISEKAQLPLLYTHTALRKYLGAERGISEIQLQAVKRTGGILGIIPSEDMLQDTPSRLAPCGAGGIPALKHQVQEAGQVVGEDAVSLGSDLNAPLSFIRADCNGSQFSDYSQLGAIWNSTQRGGLNVKKFVKVWSRVHTHPNESLNKASKK
ncbi:dipeptidase [bacterium]|jgi:microsomal dipeptidase-like Zn-dependent dipeptidase|nr:dipeptidase [bacterium]